jgi:sugar lactone lactonase YvrE
MSWVSPMYYGPPRSWGVALRHPGRLRSLAILSTPHPAALGRARRESDQTRRSSYMADLADDGAEMRLLANDAAGLRAILGSPPIPPEDVEIYVRTFQAPGTLRGALNWYRALLRSRPGTGPSRSAPLTVPTLYLWGTDDPVFGPEASRATGEFVIGPYEFQELDGVGHWILEQAPERVSKALLAHLTRRSNGDDGVDSAAGPRVTTLTLDEELPSRGRLGGISVDERGNVYVANFRGSVWRVDGRGHVERLPLDLQGSSGNAVDPDGNFFQASFLDGRIMRLAPDGTVETYVSEGLDGPVGLAAAADGTLYVCNCRGNYVARVSTDRRVERWAESPDLECPNGIALDVDGHPVVVSFRNGHVLKLARDGTARRLVSLPGPNAHVAAASDALYVTQIEDNRVYRVDRTGHATPYAGTGEPGLKDGPVPEAALARPNGIAVAPDERALLVNNLVGPWRGSEETRIVLRRIELPEVSSRLLFFDDFESGLARWEITDPAAIGIVDSGEPGHGKVLRLAPADARLLALMRGSESWPAYRLEGQLLFPTDEHNYLGWVYNLRENAGRLDFGSIYVKGNRSYIRVNPRRDWNPTRMLYEEYRTDLEGDDAIRIGEWKRFAVEVVGRVCHFYVGDMTTPKVTFDPYENDSGRAGFKPRVVGGPVWIDNIRSVSIDAPSYGGPERPAGIEHRPEMLVTEWEALGPLTRTYQAVETATGATEVPILDAGTEQRWHTFAIDARGAVVTGRLNDFLGSRTVSYFRTSLEVADPRGMRLAFSTIDDLAVWADGVFQGYIERERFAWHDFGRNPEHPPNPSDVPLTPGPHRILIRVRGGQYATGGFFARLMPLEAGDPALVAKTPHFAFYSDFTTNLHDALLEAGRARRRGDPEMFKAGEETACFDQQTPSARNGWTLAVDYYADVISSARWNERQQVLIRLDLAGVAEWERPRDRRLVGIARGFLQAAAPVYEACRWKTQDAKNRNWIEALVAQLRFHEDAISHRLAKLYQRPLGALPIRVDIVETVNWSGATTWLLDPDGGHIMISNVEHGPVSLEYLFHETSHTLMGPAHPVQNALREAAERLDVALPDDLWHAVLFYTTGDTVRRVLADAGEPTYTPLLLGGNIFGRYHEPMKRAWTAYLEGDRTLAEAAEDLLCALGAINDGHEPNHGESPPLSGRPGEPARR